MTGTKESLEPSLFRALRMKFLLTAIPFFLRFALLWAVRSIVLTWLFHVEWRHVSDTDTRPLCFSSKGVGVSPIVLTPVPP